MTNDLQLFCEQLVRLNATMAELFNTGNPALFQEMNQAIKELHRIEASGKEPAFKALHADAEIIYKNFDMIIAVLRTTENGEIDEGAQGALNRLLHNIDTAVVNIATALELV